MAGPIQSLAGVTILTMAMQAVWAIVGPVAPPIVVHSLHYDSGYIVQDRTVNSDGPFKAFWEARILDKTTGKPVVNCDGSGVWDYQSGHVTPRIPVAEWVGNPACKLPSGDYIPLASYGAGGFLVVVRGDEFTVE